MMSSICCGLRPTSPVTAILRKAANSHPRSSFCARSTAISIPLSLKSELFAASRARCLFLRWYMALALVDCAASISLCRLCLNALVKGWKQHILSPFHIEERGKFDARGQMYEQINELIYRSAKGVFVCLACAQLLPPQDFDKHVSGMIHIKKRKEWDMLDHIERWSDIISKKPRYNSVTPLNPTGSPGLCGFPIGNDAATIDSTQSGTAPAEARGVSESAAAGCGSAEMVLFIRTRLDPAFAMNSLRCACPSRERCSWRTCLWSVIR